MVGFYSPFYWQIVKSATKPVPTKNAADNAPETDEAFASLPVLDSRHQWEPEFRDADFHPRLIHSMSLVGAIFFPLSFFYGYFKAESDRVAGGDPLWFALTWTPHMICGLAMGIACACSLRDGFRRFFIKNYNSVCAGFTILIYVNTVWFNLFREIRRSKYQLSSVPHVRWGIDYSGNFPIRTCNDTDPLKSLREWPFLGTSISCNNLLFSGNVACIYALVNMIPFVLRMKAIFASVVTLCNTFILVVAVVSVGSRTWLLFSLVAFQLTAGLSAAYFCHARELLARDRFYLGKKIKTASEQKRRFLHTLMPGNVLSKLATHQGGEMLGTTIAQCTVMFCTLEPQDELRNALSGEAFDLLNRVFSDLDDAVEQFRMFKYQHVQQWYIVACPRAASPFDEAEQARPYPQQHTVDMAALAFELKRRAASFALPSGRPLTLRVGLACGPVAGAVIGSHRSFYCLYGDTINTAARMCKHAAAEPVLCTAPLAQRIASAGPSSGFIRCAARGAIDIKGKGLVEAFDLHLDPGARQLEEAHRQWKAPHWAKQGSLLGSFHRSVARAFARASSLRELLATAIADSAAAGAPTAELVARARAWAEDPGRRIHPLSAEFVDPVLERRFRAARAPMHSRHLAAGLALHLAAALLQWHALVYPEHHPDAAALGAPDIAEADGRQDCLLLAHLGCASGVCLLLLVSLLASGGRQRLAAHRRALVGLKLAMLAVSGLAGAARGGRDGWTILFASEFLCLDGLAGSLAAVLSVRSTAALMAGTTALGVASALLSPVASLGSRLQAGLTVAPVAAAAVVVAAAVHHGERARWRLHLLYVEELLRLRQIMADLIPHELASQIINGGGGCSRGCADTCGGDGAVTGAGAGGGDGAGEAGPRNRMGCRVAVLQLDICRFTAMSQELDPLEVARMIHTLFCGFDEAVRAAGLFKMDTVGDAYIVAGFLPAAAAAAAPAAPETTRLHIGRRRRSSAASTALAASAAAAAAAATESEAGRVCAGLLGVGGAILRGLETYRQATGRDVRGRVGVAVGEVLVGAVGHLQPRVHLMGRGVLAAEAMEQDGRVDAIHASAEFLRLLASARGAVADAAERPSAAGAARGTARPFVDEIVPCDPTPSESSGSWRSVASVASAVSLGPACPLPGWLITERRVSSLDPPHPPAMQEAAARAGADSVADADLRVPVLKQDAAAIGPSAAHRVRRVSYILLPEEAAAEGESAAEGGGHPVPLPSGAELLPPSPSGDPCPGCSPRLAGPTYGGMGRLVGGAALYL